ncbi:hypothetical protein N0B51_10525 [Tsuneonella sp. YG55]|uniref:Uncharacterized protein n=1 Tax=Tsuneonella litorea TaxID=2976475 RepID=A0A9X3ALL3_9SPHN|nr:hypothetical protein [Tsuneonella litorea]MCT2559413.1 hypothetical protein [Tsuneonella litorea]
MIALEPLFGGALLGRAMMTTATEALIPSLWFERIAKIASGQLGSIENALRHAAHLLQLTPSPFRDVVRLGCDETKFEGLLDAGAFDAAARYLVGQPTALSIEAQGERASYRATIGCSILGRAISGSGQTEASAILNAWTTCLLNLKTEYGDDLLNLHGQREPGLRAG